MQHRARFRFAKPVAVPAFSRSGRAVCASPSPWCASAAPQKLNNVSTTQEADLGSSDQVLRLSPVLLRKEVIQPHLPIRLPCYDFTPIIEPTFGRALLAVRLRTSGVPDSHGVTGGVYKARERIHRGMLIRDY